MREADLQPQEVRGGTDMAQKNSKRMNTETSSFGTPGRVSHNSSRFYSSRLYEGVDREKRIDYADKDHPRENPVPAEFLNRLHCKSSEKMEDLPDNSIHLMITSPPYNATKEYDDDLNLEEYLELLE